MNKLNELLNITLDDLYLFLICSYSTFYSIVTNESNEIVDITLLLSLLSCILILIYLFVVLCSFIKYEFNEMIYMMSFIVYLIAI